MANDLEWPLKDVGFSWTAFYVRSVANTLSYQIVFTSIVGVVMLMACLEWFLWLAAFIYCLIKVFRKSEHWSINVLCIIVGTSFAILR